MQRKKTVSGLTRALARYVEDVEVSLSFLKKEPVALSLKINTKQVLFLLTVKGRVVVRKRAMRWAWK